MDKFSNKAPIEGALLFYVEIYISTKGLDLFAYKFLYVYNGY